ncbi:MAG TPA: UDP-N-acetylmuramoyl-L-alanine--D-glutamate ligase [Dehalococcoidia bacterium]|nr:UDP-N-acetylmuramoyl-L-alanine--D-glutamate ligase [Dehalococcoidia bacterium]
MQLDRLGDLDFRDKRVTVVGLGTEGVDLARYLASRGAYVTVSDAKPEEKLRERIEEVLDLPVRLSLGANRPADLLEADAVFVSQGVPLELPGLDEARRRGIPIHSMFSLFMELCPGPIVGITGSSGKTTTTALVGEMFRADERPVFVGGNIGVGLLEHLSEVRAYTWAVLEVSHTQLQLAERSPHVAAVLNVTPNHLDRFSWDEYRRLKANLVRFQGSGDTAVLGYDDPEARALAREVRGGLLWFSLKAELPGDGVCVRDGWAVLRRGRRAERLFPLDALRLPGQHNQANAVAAGAIAAACGVSPEAMACAVESFAGVPHRLELVAQADAVRYYNDSIATTPERTLAGLRSFAEPIVLLRGGRDKNLPLAELAEEAGRRCRSVILFGEAAGKLEAALNGAPSRRRTQVTRVATLAEAVDTAGTAARPGDVVLLSPACTSYDAYENFERRGEHFRTLVRALVKEGEPSLP